MADGWLAAVGLAMGLSSGLGVTDDGAGPALDPLVGEAVTELVGEPFGEGDEGPVGSEVFPADTAGRRFPRVIRSAAPPTSAISSVAPTRAAIQRLRLIVRTTSVSHRSLLESPTSH